jgi:hypothetical protein
MKFYYLILLMLFFIGGINCSAQDSIADQSLFKKEVIDGDTLMATDLPPINIYADRYDWNQRDWNKYWKLVNNVRKAYPYAVLARLKLDTLNTELAKLETQREQKEYIKSVEKDILAEYEEELKKLTITQGRILIKLIDRETGNTSYELVKELRGDISAVFWQALARLFGSSLKTEYDPLGEDKLIEEIIIEIENGTL